MKHFIAILFFLLVTLSVRSQVDNKVGLAGTWTEYLGTDSSVVFQSAKRYKIYFLEKDGSFKEADSAICNTPYVITGKWEIVANKLSILHNTNDCTTQYPANIYYITWINKDEFYSVSIGRIDWEGEKVFSVFKRTK